MANGVCVSFEITVPGRFLGVANDILGKLKYILFRYRKKKICFVVDQHHCNKGFCKPQPNFCMKDGDCAKSQCCALEGKGDRAGECQNLRKPGSWCPLQVKN